MLTGLQILYSKTLAACSCKCFLSWFPSFFFFFLLWWQRFWQLKERKHTTCTSASLKVWSNLLVQRRTNGGQKKISTSVWLHVDRTNNNLTCHREGWLRQRSRRSRPCSRWCRWWSTPPRSPHTASRCSPTDTHTDRCSAHTRPGPRSPHRHCCSYKGPLGGGMGETGNTWYVYLSLHLWLARLHRYSPARHEINFFFFDRGNPSLHWMLPLSQQDVETNFI